MVSFQVTAAQTDEELQAILDLQRVNQRDRIAAEVAQSQGFVTVEHDFDLLKRMNQAAPQVIAKGDSGELAGYALTMLQSFRSQIPVLMPMFEMIDGLSYQGKLLRQAPYYVMGQVCVAEAFRGMGVFDALYEQHKKMYHSDFEFIVTEIALRNTRSMAAHQRVGFEQIHTYFDEAAQEDWAVVAMNLSQ
jgi:ribosomal protein S18 acetylase RimI-like enzyme